MCDIRKCLYLRPHTLYVNDIWTLYGITHIAMTTQPLCNFTATMSDITPTVSVSSHIMYQYYQTQYMYDITATMCMASYALYITSYPNFLTTILSIYDITCTVFMTAHALYMTCHLLCMISRSLYV